MSDHKENELLAILQEGQIITDSSVHKLTFEQKKMIVISALVSTHSSSLLYRTIKQYLDKHFTKEIIKEAMFQGIPYIGVSHIYDAQSVLIKVLTDLEASSSFIPVRKISQNKKYDIGLDIQKSIIPEFTKDMFENSAPDERALTVQFLTTFCFGSIYSRGVISLEDRELLTYSYLICSSRDYVMLKRHIGACLKLGFDRQTLVEVILIAAPFIGFPRCFTALRTLNEVVPPTKDKLKNPQITTNVNKDDEETTSATQTVAQNANDNTDKVNVAVPQQETIKAHAEKKQEATPNINNQQIPKYQEPKDTTTAYSQFANIDSSQLSPTQKIRLMNDFVSKHINTPTDIELIKKILAIRIKTMQNNK